MAAEQLIRLAEHGSSDDVQRRASEAVLDRAGVRPGVEIDVVTADIGGRSPADVLRERIAVVQRRLAGATSASALPDASPTARSWEDLLQLPSSAGPEDADEVE